MKAILQSVSRSFYLTIKFLPRPLRDPVSLAYLLARATDTIADTASIAVEVRLTNLLALARVIAGELDFAAIAEALRNFAAHQSDPAERKLIENLPDCFAWLEKMDPADRTDIRAVLQTIVKGQELDLRRFGDPATAVPLRSAAELDEYTYLVAGCVGEFWTNVGFRRLPPFARRSPDEMKKLGIDYGKGLQLINILRDRAADEKNGRLYFPAAEDVTPWLDPSRGADRRRNRVRFCPNELANALRHSFAGLDRRAHDRVAACGRPGGGSARNQSSASGGAPHSPRRRPRHGFTAGVARTLRALARDVDAALWAARGNGNPDGLEGDASPWLNFAGLST